MTTSRVKIPDAVQLLLHDAERADDAAGGLADRDDLNRRLALFSKKDAKHCARCFRHACVAWDRYAAKLYDFIQEYPVADFVDGDEYELLRLDGLAYDALARADQYEALYKMVRRLIKKG